MSGFARMLVLVLYIRFLFLLLYSRVTFCCVTIQMGGTTNRVIWFLMHKENIARKNYYIYEVFLND